jgi:(1->4)-alpha-D-glucan 1-alpha-D-glucosylmutase
MLLPAPDAATSAAENARRRRFAMKFQQYTAPVHAKGVEDTAFYRSTALLSLNEVGGDPTRFGRGVAEFHDDNRARQARWPLSLTATATHDTKRGEDARARINVLSEIPREWRSAIGRWSRITAPVRRVVQDAPAPSPNEEYLFYQTLIAAWPAGAQRTPDSEFVERISTFMVKASREAKVNTSWVNPAAEHEAAVLDFVQQTLGGSIARRFTRSFVPFAERVAQLGMLNSLAQLTLKIASPGIPDFYGGTELWDLSLVDPDNRRAVDFPSRRAMLEELITLGDHAARGDAGTAPATAALLEHWTDGRIKMYVTHAGLNLRRRHPKIFTDGSYDPMPAEGMRGDNVVAFARRHGAYTALALVPRLVVGLANDGAALPIGAEVWADTTLQIPDAVARGAYRNVFTGETLRVDGAAVRVADALTTLPIGLWLASSGT